MAHFAKLDHDGIVLGVYTVHDSEALTEESGCSYLEGWSNGHPYWKQCSYNATIRKNFPGQGYHYDPVRDAFIPPQPFPSWVLDENTCLWAAPMPYPNDGHQYIWDEQITNWRKV